MKFQTNITVVGAKFSKGTLENGSAYDSTKIYALIDLDNSRGNSVGQGVAEYTWGDSTNFDLIKPHMQKLPADFVAEFSIVTSGKLTKTVLENIKLKSA